jgi:hypothetical protein
LTKHLLTLGSGARRSGRREPKDGKRAVMSKKTSNKTKDLNRRHTAWFQLVSCAGAFMDRYNGKVTEETLRQVQRLHECAERVMEVEGIHPVSDKSFG